jgi:hypothetical protein
MVGFPCGLGGSEWLGTPTSLPLGDLADRLRVSVLPAQAQGTLACDMVARDDVCGKYTLQLPTSCAEPPIAVRSEEGYSS